MWLKNCRRFAKDFYQTKKKKETCLHMKSCYVLCVCVYARVFGKKITGMKREYELYQSWTQSAILSEYIRDKEKYSHIQSNTHTQTHFSHQVPMFARSTASLIHLMAIFFFILFIIIVHISNKRLKFHADSNTWVYEWKNGVRTIYEWCARCTIVALAVAWFLVDQCEVVRIYVFFLRNSLFLYFRIFFMTVKVKWFILMNVIWHLK